MGRLLDYYSSDESEREELRAIRNTQPVISASVPNPSVPDEEFFPWHTDFKDEPNYLETLLGKDSLDVSSEAEDCQRIEQNEENLFLAEIKKLSVKKI